MSMLKYAFIKKYLPANKIWISDPHALLIENSSTLLYNLHILDKQLSIFVEIKEANLHFRTRGVVIAVT